jgi:ComF family protein
VDTLEAVCGQCQQQPPPFDRVLSPFLYQTPVDHLILQLKFSQRLEMARLLGELMARWLEPRLDSRPDEIIPVPLHPRRQRTRGFNQALELARPIARHLQLPLNTRSCQRQRYTAPQTGLDATARARNVKKAFQIKGPLGRRIALVDDVMTTGQTMQALAKALRKAGAEEVEVWVCARA